MHIVPPAGKAMENHSIRETHQDPLHHSELRASLNTLYCIRATRKRSNTTCFQPARITDAKALNETQAVTGLADRLSFYVPTCREQNSSPCAQKQYTAEGSAEKRKRSAQE